MSSLPPPPGVTLMTAGDARREFPDKEIGPALPAWGGSPALPPAPDDSWCWVLDAGAEVRSRFKTREEALMDSWRTLWWICESYAYTSPEQKRQMRDAKIAFLMEQGWGFPDDYKRRRREHDAIERSRRQWIEQERATEFTGK